MQTMNIPENPEVSTVPERRGIGAVTTILLVLVAVVAAGAGGYYLAKQDYDKKLTEQQDITGQQVQALIQPAGDFAQGFVGAWALSADFRSTGYQNQVTTQMAKTLKAAKAGTDPVYCLSSVPTTTKFDPSKTQADGTATVVAHFTPASGTAQDATYALKLGDDSRWRLDSVKCAAAKPAATSTGTTTK